MKSAYMVLGIPGNASAEDVEAAFKGACERYSSARLASDPQAADKLTDLKNAYAVLRDPLSRAAHDRKLAKAAQARTSAPVRIIYHEESAARPFLKWGLFVLAMIFAAGYFVSWRNAETRKAQALAELAEKQAAEREAEERKRESENAEAQRAQVRAKQEAEERRFALESQAVGARVMAERERQQQNALAQQRAELAEQRRNEQRAAGEARARLEQDKRRIREACWSLYRRTDC